MSPVSLRRWSWIHKWSSLVCTVFMLLLCLTGLPLIYSHEIGQLLGNEVEPPALPATQSSSTPPRASLDSVIAAGKARYPDKVRELRRHSKAKLATENMFHTLLDLNDIHYAGEKLDWSFVNPAFKQHKRYVDSYGWTNYDNATLKGDCREIIDKGKPLKQDK